MALWSGVLGFLGVTRASGGPISSGVLRSLLRGGRRSAPLAERGGLMWVSLGRPVGAMLAWAGCGIRARVSVVTYHLAGVSSAGRDWWEASYK